MGRVEVNYGVPTVSVGLKCPEGIVEKVIQFMGLKYYKDIIRVVTASYLDSYK
jgi:hypothetical protein